MATVVIIEDEQQLRELNRNLISDNFPSIEVVGEADSVESGIEIIQKTKPDIVLLDIELKGGTGFNILQNVKPYNFKLIFVTAYNHLAIKAIKFSAIDYILKPINEFEFTNAIENALQSIQSNEMEMQVNNFFDHYEKQTQSKKIVLRTSDSMHIIDVSDILYCQSDNSYTTFYLADGTHILVSKPLKEYNDLLEGFNFIRPHQSYLVNLNSIKKVDKTDGGFIILNNNTEIPISTRRKQSLMQVFDKL
ncbi:MAG: LytTR family DNA-binding domain-containing protein [Salinivirgaceae bacterium]|jgi:two-component system LytT family response regulator|nr:LytTR family DNA-binding domain-containing protein [Salinivirgaceae bacterium]